MLTVCLDERLKLRYICSKVLQEWRKSQYYLEYVSSVLVKASDIARVVTLAVHLMPAVWCAGTPRVHAIVLTAICCTLVRDKVLRLMNTTIKAWSVLECDKVVADGYRSQSFWFLWRSFLLQLYCCSHLSNHVVNLKNINLEFVMLVSAELLEIYKVFSTLNLTLKYYLQLNLFNNAIKTLFF